ncbi:MAG: sulfotransferase domain-containing protein [Bacteroidia bacterium]
MPQYPKIDIVIAGTRKSFTTSLKNYIGEHPSVLTHPQVEMSYFIDDAEYANGYAKAVLHYYRNYEKFRNKKVVAKTASLYTTEAGVKRLAEHNPDCKIILSMRNPVDRAYSAYFMEYNYANVEFPFDEIKELGQKGDKQCTIFNNLLDSGNYAKHLRMIYKYFPKEQVKVILCDDILNNPADVCREIFSWIGVESTFIPEIKVHNPTSLRGSKMYAKFVPAVLKPNSLLRKSVNLLIPPYYNHRIGNIVRRLNKTGGRYEAMNPATREYLVDYYRKANKELEEMTGKKVTILWNK